MSAHLRILIVEDRPANAELVVCKLREAGFDSDIRRAKSEPDFLAQLEFAPDVLLADSCLREFDGPREMQVLKEHSPGIPLIIVSGDVVGEAVAECMKLGLGLVD